MFFCSKFLIIRIKSVSFPLWQRGETPFFASHGRIETMKVLLDAGADIDAKDEV